MKTKVLFTISVFCMLCIAALAQDKQAFSAYSCSIGRPYEWNPIDGIGFNYYGRIATSDDAEGFLMCGDEIIMRGQISVTNWSNSSMASLTFSDGAYLHDGELLLPRGKSYKAVIPAGVLWLESNPDVKNEEAVVSFSVPEYLQPKDGYLADVVESFDLMTFYFYNETKGLGEPKAYLYREGKLVRILRVNVTYDWDLGQAIVFFGDNLFDYVHFEEGVNYSVVLPEGSICAYRREDIVNQELRYDFIGGYSGVMPVVRHVRCSLDGVSGLNEIGEVDLYYDMGLFLTPDAKLQLYDGATLIKEVEAKLSEQDGGSGCVLTADFGGVSTAGHKALALVVPEATLATVDGDIAVNERTEIPIDIAAGISGVEADGGVKVACSGGVLTVSNARQGAGITVCSVDGKIVSRCTAGGASVDIPLPGDGVYIVNVDGKTYKIASQAMKN